MDTFEHTPLDRSKECIRLLRFVDQPPFSKLDHFALETYDLDAAPPFVALSYTWGRFKPSQKIIVNGSLLNIRDNLSVALKALRHFFPNKAPTLDMLRRWESIGKTPPEDLLQEGGYPLMWIDAICINQSDNSEKNHQVNLMGRIFSTAERVISWLGDEADNSSSVMKAIRATTHTVHYHSEVKQAMEAFAKRSYWRRMWVIQEFVLPQDLIILCGHEGAWWEDLFHFWQGEKLFPGADGSHHRFSGDSDQGGLAALIFARRFRHHDSQSGCQSGNRRLPFNTIMDRFKYGECSDPRDRIYALLTLIAPRVGVKPLLADYTISAKDLYYRVLASGYAESPMHTSFREELREALGGSSWANTEAAKLNEAVYKTIELAQWNTEQDALMGCVPFEAEQYLIDKFGGSSKLGLGDWTSCEMSQRFPAFPLGEDPRTWQLFNILIRRLLFERKVDVRRLNWCSSDCLHCRELKRYYQFEELCNAGAPSFTRGY